MTCRELVDFIADYLENELPAAERLRFEAHVAECKQCRRYLESYAATVELSRTALAEPEAPVPEGVPEALVQAILRARRES